MGDWIENPMICNNQYDYPSGDTYNELDAIDLAYEQYEDYEDKE